jgi:hypothetical protein
MNLNSPVYLVAAGLVSLAAAIFAAIGLNEPTMLGWTGPAPLWGRVGLVLLLCAPIAWLLAARGQLRSLWVLRNEPPVEMYVELERVKDSYYANLRAAPGETVLHRVPIYPPSATVDGLQPAKVYMDIESGKPMVLEVQGHRLWAMNRTPG